MHYPAFIEIGENGSASGWFPDVDGCIFAGDTIEETIADAHGAIDAHFEALAEYGMEIPKPRPMQEHIAANAAEYVGGQWVLIHINMDKFDGRAERINITMPHRLIHQIDDAVKHHSQYGSRSAFIAAATRNELHRVS